MATDFLPITINSHNDWESAALLIQQNFGTYKKIMLLGEMGAGKTTFTQAFCKNLGVQEVVNSPTFPIINQYHYHNHLQQIVPFYHIDLYRLQILQEAIDIGIDDILDDENYCIVEWYQLIAPILPEKVLFIHIELLQNNQRCITCSTI
ncbi:MAG: tRNA (adenosine(37)-N6)-threonylcarbamoyltransferase complex ATPase subunit type 1 TsaE [Saprospiraceae bacterium]|nr:tRNA (adenosine(37)-N6)-threonylcarbamoyltransferase complex ATPase subunit type 1 TsaE [Saprospiraceae bacterium]MBP7699556.1 tRNA (adenosine(37)-N6)-threonylcarbamoyltransferase complex ATPase subunit type 1 TsaE [Saprospiraceae bacterium]